MRKKLLWIFLTIPLILSVLSVNTIKVNAVETRDIAVVSVTPSQTSVRLGELVNITVVVKNNGTVDETFNATAYYDTTAIETKTVQNLTAGLTTPLTFTWNTTDVREEIYATDNKERTYTINATASTVPGETNTGDNTLPSPLPTITIMSYYIAVVPQSIVDPNLDLGKNFTVSIYTDYNGTDIWSWQFILTYNPLVLHGVNITNGDLITKEKDPSADFIPGTFNNTLGKLSLTTAYFYYVAPDEPYVTSGPGTLANITFTVMGTGDSNIILVEDKVELTNPKKGVLEKVIINRFLPYFGHILYGYFRNTAEPVTHDIAVVSVTPSPTSVEEGVVVNITVVVENQGTVAETFDVKVYYDYEPQFPDFHVIGTKTAQNLADGANQSLTFAWNTTGVPGNHTITAVVSKLPGEADTDDNTRQSDEMVTVTAREEQPLPVTELIIGIVVVVVVIAVVWYALKRRKKSPSE